MKSIEKATTFWSRPRARHEPNDHKLVKKSALWRLDVPFPPCLWRGVTDDLVKSRSEHAAVRLTTQCVPCGAQTRFQKGSGTFRRPCARVRPPRVSGHAAAGPRRQSARQVGLLHCKTQSCTAAGRRANACQLWHAPAPHCGTQSCKKSPQTCPMATRARGHR